MCLWKRGRQNGVRGLRDAAVSEPLRHFPLSSLLSLNLNLRSSLSMLLL